MVVVGLGVFAGSGFVAKAGGTTNPDTCGYNPAAAPKPGGGTVIFDENSVTRAIGIYGLGSGAHIGVFANDESSLFVGTGGAAFQSGGAMTLSGGLTLNSTYTSISVNTPHAAVTSGDSIILKNGSGTQTVKASANVASGVSTIPVVSFKAGKTFSSGDSATDTNANLAYGSVAPAALGTGTDSVGRFQAPSLYITDITNGFSNAGDYEQGGSRVSPSTADGLFGGWSNVIGSPPSVKNNWTLGPNADTPPAGTTSFNEGYGTEVVWNVSSLTYNGGALQAGHTYRVQSITHDDDQNHTSGGGDVGEVCGTIGIPGITTTATGDMIHVDGTANVSDTATVGGVATPLPSGTSQVEFKVYGPDPTPGGITTDDCSGTPQTKNVTLNSTTPNGAYPSGNFTVSAPGDYHFTADLRVGGTIVASSLCDATHETATVTSRPTSLTTDARNPNSADGTYSPTTTLSDVATLSGGTTNAGGTLTFTLYADNGSGGCAATALGSTQVTVNNGANGATYTGTLTSTALTPPLAFFGAGTYHWSVTYGGDPATGNQSSSDGVPCPATDTSTNHENPVVNSPHISITKSPKNQTIEAAGNGELTPASGTTPGTATWTLHVTNDGNTDLTNVVVTDPNATNCAQNVGNLAKGASVDVLPAQCFITGLTGTSFHNQANVSGHAGAQTVTSSDTADVTLINPHIQVTKTPPTQSVSLGGIAHFTITVTNDGDVALSSVVVSDAQAQGCARTASQTATLITNQDGGSFDHGDSFTYNCDSDPVQAPFTNAVGACGNDSLNGTVCDNDGNNGTPNSDCTTAGGHSGDQCAGVGIDSIASSQDFKPKDTATVSVNGPHGTLNGKVDFSLYKGTCVSNHLIYQDLNESVTAGQASTASANFLSTLLANAGLSADTAGTYNWAITYHGDTNGNADLTSACGTENFVVTNG